ncbi:MAG: DUF5678 domain-containing protein [Candidatus Aenigmatarchaeota archaeon]
MDEAGKPLVEPSKGWDEYRGKWVATHSFTDYTVAGWGETPGKAYRDALENGVKDPVLFYIPKLGEHSIFSHSGNICRN